MTAPLPQEFAAPSGISERFDELYREMFVPLVKFARRRLPSRSDAEDIVQESFLKVMERIDPEVLESAPSYLTRVVRNGVIGELRSRAARERATARIVEPQEVDPTLRLEENELSDAVHRLSSKLPSRQRRFIGLYALGMTPAEIAQIESRKGRILSAHQVSCTLSRATSRLRTLLERTGFAFVPTWLSNAYGRARVKIVRFQELGTRMATEILQIAFVAAVGIGLGLASLPTEESQVSRPDSSPSSEVFQSAEAEGSQARAMLSGRGPTRVTGSASMTRIVVPGTPGELEGGTERDGQAPGLIEQITDIVEDPGGGNPFKCWGIGIPVCSE